MSDQEKWTFVPGEETKHKQRLAFVKQEIANEGNPEVVQQLLRLAEIWRVARQSHGSVHKLASGKELRRATIFFQKETHKALKTHAAEEDRKVSDVVEEAVRKYLA